MGLFVLGLIILSIVIIRTRWPHLFGAAAKQLRQLKKASSHKDESHEKKPDDHKKEKKSDDHHGDSHGKSGFFGKIGSGIKSVWNGLFILFMAVIIAVGMFWMLGTVFPYAGYGIGKAWSWIMNEPEMARMREYRARQQQAKDARQARVRTRLEAQLVRARIEAQEHIFSLKPGEYTPWYRIPDGGYDVNWKTEGTGGVAIQCSSGSLMPIKHATGETYICEPGMHHTWFRIKSIRPEGELLTGRVTFKLRII